MIFYHIILSNKDVFLKVNQRQFKCHFCQKPFSESLHFQNEKKISVIIGNPPYNAKQENITDWALIKFRKTTA